MEISVVLPYSYYCKYCEEITRCDYYVEGKYLFYVCRKCGFICQRIDKESSETSSNHRNV